MFKSIRKWMTEKPLRCRFGRHKDWVREDRKSTRTPLTNGEEVTNDNIQECACGEVFETFDYTKVIKKRYNKADGKAA